MVDQSGSHDVVADVFRQEWPRLVARLVRDVGDVGLAEEAAQEAFIEATTRWERTGPPDVPAAWLLTTARRKAIDALRRSRRLTERLNDLVERERRASAAAQRWDDQGEGWSDSVDDTTAGDRGDLVDDQLALLLGCCHPALAPDAQVALTLRIVAGLSSAQIARAFFVSEPTMVRRLSRSKAKIRATNIPFGRANIAMLHERLPSVCAVVYSIFTEGHASATAATLVRGDLCDEAVWLGTLLHELVPDDPEVAGLLALMLLIDARRATRVDADGSPVLLADQDRTGWDTEQIARGLSTLARAHAGRRGGPYQLQAAIAALHATAPTFYDTDWTGIIRLYDVLIARRPSALLELNRAVAIFQRDGPDAGLAALDAIDQRTDPASAVAPDSNAVAGSDRGPDGVLDAYPYAHSARGEMLAAAGRPVEAVAAFERATARSSNDAERTHLLGRLAALRSNPSG